MMSAHWRCYAVDRRSPVYLRGTLAEPFGVAANGPQAPQGALRGPSIW